MNKKERKEIEEQVRNDFFKRFSLEFLDEDGKQFALETAIQAIITKKEFINFYDSSSKCAYLLGAISMQNLYSLTAIHESNDKLDTIIQQNKEIIDLNKQIVNLLSKLTDK